MTLYASIGREFGTSTSSEVRGPSLNDLYF